MVNILRLTVTYLNATINVKPETQNWRLEPTGLAKPGDTRGLTGTGPGLAHQESAGWAFGRFWNRTDPLLRSKPGPLAGYPDPLLTLRVIEHIIVHGDNVMQCEHMRLWNPQGSVWEWPQHIRDILHKGRLILSCAQWLVITEFWVSKRLLWELK